MAPAFAVDDEAQLDPMPAWAAAARAATRGAALVTHFNNAGCALPSDATAAAVAAHLDAEATLGGYEAAEAAAPALERVYASLAALLHCAPSEVAVLSSATAAWQQAAYGLAAAWRRGDRVLTFSSEYGSNAIALLQLCRRTGAVLEVVPDGAAGGADLAALEAAAARPPRPVLVSLTHVATSSGRVMDAAGVGEIAARHGIPYLLDACQSAGQLPLDVRALRCDFLSATARKFLRGPRGCGFLYARAASARLLEPGALDNVGARWLPGGTAYKVARDATRFESYELSVAAKVGLGVAAAEAAALDGAAVAARVAGLAAALRRRLAAARGVAVADAAGAPLCGIVAFVVEGLPAERVRAALAAAAPRRVNVSVSRAGSTRWDFEARGLAEVVRASPHYYNTLAEVDALAAEVARIAAAVEGG